jgi:hypothetical protein
MHEIGRAAKLLTYLQTSEWMIGEIDTVMQSNRPTEYGNSLKKIVKRMRPKSSAEIL